MDGYVEIPPSDKLYEWVMRLVQEEHVFAQCTDEKIVSSSVIVAIDEHGRTRKYLILDSNVYLKINESC